MDLIQHLSPGLSGAAFNSVGKRQDKAFVPTLNI